MSFWRKCVCEYRADVFYIFSLNSWSFHTPNMTGCFTVHFNSYSPLKFGNFFSVGQFCFWKSSRYISWFRFQIADICTEKLTVSCFCHVTGAYFVKEKLPSPQFYLQSQFLFEVKISVSLKICLPVLVIISIKNGTCVNKNWINWKIFQRDNFGITYTCILCFVIFTWCRDVLYKGAGTEVKESKVPWMILPKNLI